MNGGVNKTGSFLSRNCFCSEDLNELLGDLVATYGNVDTFVLSLQNCRFVVSYILNLDYDPGAGVDMLLGKTDKKKERQTDKMH